MVGREGEGLTMCVTSVVRSFLAFDARDSKRSGLNAGRFVRMTVAGTRSERASRSGVPFAWSRLDGFWSRWVCRLRKGLVRWKGNTGLSLCEFFYLNVIDRIGYWNRVPQGLTAPFGKRRYI